MDLPVDLTVWKQKSLKVVLIEEVFKVRKRVSVPVNNSTGIDMDKQQVNSPIKMLMYQEVQV